MKNHNFSVAMCSLAIIAISFTSGCKPDARGTIESFAKVYYPGKEVGDSINIIVHNNGANIEDTFFVDLVLSSDTIIPVREAIGSYQFEEDMLMIPGGRDPVYGLQSGKSLNLTGRLRGKISDNTPPGNYYIGVVFDSQNKITESNESNNVAMCPIKVVIK